MASRIQREREGEWGGEYSLLLLTRASWLVNSEYGGGDALQRARPAGAFRLLRARHYRAAAGVNAVPPPPRASSSTAYRGAKKREGSMARRGCYAVTNDAACLLRFHSRAAFFAKRNMPGHSPMEVISRRRAMAASRRQKMAGSHYADHTATPADLAYGGRHSGKKVGGVKGSKQQSDGIRIYPPACCAATYFAPDPKFAIHPATMCIFESV